MKSIKTIYFDRNVFDYINRGNSITEDEMKLLKAVLNCGAASILLSVPLLEEQLLFLESNTTKYDESLRLLRSLTASSKLIKDHQSLIIDDIRAYALAEPQPEPFTTEFGDILSDLSTDGANVQELLCVIAQTKQAKAEVQVEFQIAKENDSAYFNSLPKSRRPNFKDYYKAHAIEIAAGLADRLGVLTQCEARGLEGLLDIKSVAVWVGANLSLGFAQIREGWNTDRGDWHDMQHAVVGTAADVFVTQDKGLARVLARVEVNGFRVIDLRALLEELLSYYLVKAEG